MLLQEITDVALWDQFVESHPYGHPLQLWAWGDLKRANGWSPYRLAVMDGSQIVAAAQLLMWPIPKLGKMVAYIPRGPVAEPNKPATKQLLDQVVAFARDHKALYIHVEPAWINAKRPAGWKQSHQKILLPQTYVIDLSKPEQQLLASMRSKTRQYIRKADSLGVEIERLDYQQTSPESQAEYLEYFWDIYKHTAKRAGFGLHDFGYYQKLWELYGNHNRLYFAKASGQILAFLWVVESGSVAFELYGGINETGASLKANYLLKWAAIVEAQQRGMRVYDFNGRLNEGVSQFKEGFGPEEVEFVGPWDWPLGKVGYALWQKLLPALKPIGRRIIKAGKK